MYSNSKIKNINILASLESLKWSLMLKACLKRLLYILLEFKPKNLKNQKSSYLVLLKV